MHDIYLPYTALDGDHRACMPWAPNGRHRTSILEENLGFDHRLRRVHIDDLKQGQRWLYELNWFGFEADGQYGWADLSQLSTNPRLMDDVRNGTGLVIANLSFEASIPDTQALHTMIDQHGIPNRALIWATGSHDASKQVRRLDLDAMPLTVRASESMSALWLGDRINALPSREIHKRFICFMRRYRPHRFQLLYNLDIAGLLDQFYISFPRSAEGMDASQAARWLCAALPDGNDMMAHIERIYYSLPFVIDPVDPDINLCTTQLRDAALPWYMRSGISVVAETVYDCPETFISEKTYHPMRYLQPFILVAPAGSLRALRSDGYKTFGDVWDESYDDESDAQVRMRMIIDLLMEIASWDRPRFEQAMRHSEHICRHNLTLLGQCHMRSDHVANLSSLWS